MIMTAGVFQRKKPDWTAFEQPDSVDLSEFVAVAQVQVEVESEAEGFLMQALEEVYALTQNGVVFDGPWQENAGVISSGGPYRSTSVGDVVSLFGKFYIVDSCGFKPVKAGACCG